MHCSTNALDPVDRAVALRHPVALELRQLVAARVRALVELVPAAELAADRVPEQLDELDLVDCVVAVRAAVEAVERAAGAPAFFQSRELDGWTISAPPVWFSMIDLIAG